MNIVANKAVTIGTTLGVAVAGAATYAVLSGGHAASAQEPVVNAHISDASTTAAPVDTSTPTDTATPTTGPSATNSAVPVATDTTSVAPSQQPVAPASSAAPAPSSPAAAVTPKPITPPSGPCYENHTVSFTESVTGGIATVSGSYGVVGGSTSSYSTSTTFSTTMNVYGCQQLRINATQMNVSGKGSVSTRCSISIDGSVADSSSSNTGAECLAKP